MMLPSSPAMKEPRNAALRAQAPRRPPRAAAVRRAPGSAAPPGLGMTGPHLATRAAGADATPPEPGQAGRFRVLAAVRPHWLVAALLVAGLVLRVLAFIAYQPAL